MPTSAFDWYESDDGESPSKKSSAYVGISQCLQAIQNDDGQNLEKLITKFGVDCNITFKKRGEDRGLIYEAIEWRARNCVEVLCNAGVSLIPNENFESPLMMGCKFADKQIVKILLDNGADCLYKTNNTDNGLGSIAGVSFSCFDFLLSKPICGKEIIRMILEHQNTKLITEKEKKAFKSSGYSLAYRVMMMSDKDAEDVIEMLIDAGLCHDYQKGTEQTLLDRAWNLQKFGVLRILIQRGFTNLSGKVKYNFANIPFTVVLTLLRSSNDARKYLTKAIKKEESPEIYAEIVKPLSLQDICRCAIRDNHYKDIERLPQMFQQYVRFQLEHEDLYYLVDINKEE